MQAIVRSGGSSSLVLDAPDTTLQDRNHVDDCRNAWIVSLAPQYVRYLIASHVSSALGTSRTLFPSPSLFSIFLDASFLSKLVADAVRHMHTPAALA